MATENLSTDGGEMISFKIISDVAIAGPRLATLFIRGRDPISTPNFIATTSRGIIPHISPDVQAAHLKIAGVYMSTEDFIEKAPKAIPPVYEIPPDADSSYSRLRRFTGLSNGPVLIAGLRRPNPLPSTAPNTNETIAICTSVGFRAERVDNYIESAKILGSDIFIGPADVVFADKCSEKRKEKTVDRTVEWTEKLISILASTPQDPITPKPIIFASILPLSALEQRMYTAELADQHLQHISGLALYDPSIFPDLPASLRSLTALSLSPPATPHDVLSQLSQGMDLILPSFTSSASDSGLALTFSFPPPSNPPTDQQPLAVDISPSEVHSTSTIPLQEKCECYACRIHTRAYVNHLLAAREMMAWNLLQIHNHHITSQFFSGIRASIEAGSFEADCAAFENYYQKDLPISVLGVGPRVRGYEMKSGRSQAKPNPKAFDPKLKSQPLGTLPNVEGSEITEFVGSLELEEHGMGVGNTDI